ncbi:MAG: serine protein kinase RIO [bacterium]
MTEKWEQVVERALATLRDEPRRKESQISTEGEVFDPPTLEALYRLITHGDLATLDFCVSTGKEANVFRGTTPEKAHVAVKIYRVLTSSFRSHQDYLWGDPRFSIAGLGKRGIVETWAAKEFKNLARFTDAGCRVPTPLIVKKNVLVMEFIGVEGAGAPMLRDVGLPDPAATLDELVGFVKSAWRKGGLVHGDLSEFNVLVRGDELVVIDTAQAVLKAHPRARELLLRDLTNLAKTFRRLGVEADAERLVADVLKEGP